VLVIQLSLGTAQWGSAYGVTNSGGRLSDAECASIIEEITTKVSGSDASTLRSSAEASLMELQVECVESLLIHDWETLTIDAQARAVNELGAIIHQGLAVSVGVSVYEEYGVVSALELFAAADVPFGVVQVPANALDQRLDDSRVMQELASRGTRVQIRSVLLQGLLAQSPVDGAARHPDLAAFYEHAVVQRRSPIQIALAHVKSLPWVDDVVIGVTSSTELQQITEAWASADPIRLPRALASKDRNLIDPRLW
jgi:aryl-alcohol dehydrogenase-like predicted oxidoreductase